MTPEQTWAYLQYKQPDPSIIFRMQSKHPRSSLLLWRSQVALPLQLFSKKTILQINTAIPGEKTQNPKHIKIWLENGQENKKVAFFVCLFVLVTKSLMYINSASN